ncbi:HlyD family efflux transporter periplasmic adaptor subunit [Pelagovum pacificum]|uniref:HlyD family efflux transporter periplasmic adaptor subunit n=1 Tax=Pelagovum pacificum TaxID=2588711 RepID=A0A5C5G9P3_9RHOB|nr:HlyD family efflux transporter periplasmic adaptor subunit [Pelagovum pacificum]QQA41859.1 HlyD family efflux transporter periplasmic adaptor subunit [Pelagovum pacificum]TNY30698.1 HlyD family efflux transporter periplasmic adaptor subunit [Pelagovum pacificum]
MAAIDTDLRGATRGASTLIWIVCATVVLFLGWAKFASLDEIVRGSGEVVSGARPQIIQNLEGGILGELVVNEGDLVEAGDVLARLRGTTFSTRVDDLSEQIVAADIRRLRLEAEMAGQFDFELPAAYTETSPEIVASERALLNARQSDYTSRVEGARRVQAETARELDTLEDLYNREIVALLEVTQARKANSDAENRVNEIVTSYELDEATAYSEVLLELATLKQELRLVQDQLERTVIRSPMRGIVNAVGVSTIGGVIRPGEEIFEIIPAGDDVYIEAQVAPKDIAHVVAGQNATIKLTAYDYTIHGSLSGTVEMVSADTFKDERRPEADAHYRVTVAIDRDALTPRQADIELRPGMQATVELHTGSKTVLDYLTKPLYRSSEALREP